MTTAFALAEPSKLRWRGGSGDLKELASFAETEAFTRPERMADTPPTLTAILEGRSVIVTLDRVLASKAGGTTRLVGILQEIFRRLPDRAALARRLEDGGRIPVVALQGGPTALVTNGAVVGLNEVLLKRPSLARALICTAILRGLRQRAEVIADVQDVKRDVGSAVLALACDADAREKVDAAELQRLLGALFAPNEPFFQQLHAFLLARPIQEDPGSSRADNIFFDPKRFDALTLGGKLRVIAAGQLAWYSSLSLGLLGLFRPLFQLFPGHYDEARQALKGGPGARGINFFEALRRRVYPALRRARILLGVELFWSAYNPHMTRVVIRPFFRLMGGNQRPFAATLATFLFSFAVVHLMGLTSLIIAIAWFSARSAQEPSLAGAIASERTIRIQLSIFGVYLLFGLLAALAKWRRFQRVNSQPQEHS